MRNDNGIFVPRGHVTANGLSCAFLLKVTQREIGFGRRHGEG